MHRIFCKLGQNLEYKGEERTALFWVIMQRVVVIFTDVWGQPVGIIIRVPEFKIPFEFLNPEYEADKLSQNIGKELPLLAV
jgi:hypothetical protein